jgi:4-amino-4-deoxy-L-arabinose transferase-like glycosyltransferase
MHNENIPGKSWLAMVFLALLLSFSFQCSKGLYETTEGRYAECAREMIESGNYLEPTLGYRPHWTNHLSGEITDADF